MKSFLAAVRIATSALLLLTPANGDTDTGYRNLSRDDTIDAILRRLDPTAKENDESSLEYTLKIRELWLSAGDFVAEECGEKFAADVMAYLRTATHIARPSGENGETTVFGDPDDKQKHLVMVIVTATDLTKYPDQAKALEPAPAIALFLALKKPALPLIVLRHTDQISEKWRGILLLHSGGLAKDFADQAYDSGGGSYGPAESEVKIHGLENKLMSKLGGRRYSKLLMRYVRGVREKKGSLVIPGGGHYDKRLDEVFGPAYSEAERASRQAHFTVNVAFRYLEIRDA
ncbi:MAG: hypothetical protein AAB467_00315, partial [Patescibacteria group bacterium]